MIMLTTPIVTLALVLTTGVSAAYVPSDLEPRTPAAELGRTVLNVAKTAGRTTGRRVMTTPRMPMRFPANPAPQAAKQSTGLSGKQVTAGMVGGKIMGGLLVGGGSLAAGRVDNAVNKRDDEEIVELFVRNPALRQGARLATQTLRNAARPIARPATRRIVPPPRPISPPPGGLGSKIKSGGTIAGLAMTAGAGEYLGQKHMDNAIDRLNSRSVEVEDLIKAILARELLEDDILERGLDPEEEAFWVRDFDEAEYVGRGLSGDDNLELRDLDDHLELFERTPATHAAKLAQTALRTAARTRPPANIARPASNALRTAGKVGAYGGAAFTGGWFEGMAQNVNIPTQQAIAKDPKGSAQKMIPNNRVTQALGLKGREFSENEVLAIRALLMELEDALD